MRLELDRVTIEPLNLQRLLGVGSDISAGSGNGGRGEAGIAVPLAGPQEVGDLRVRAAIDEIADPIPAVEEPSVRPVDEPDRAFGPDNALEAGRVRPRVGRGSLRHTADGIPHRRATPTAR